MEDKLEPSITYLQKLGPEHIKQIFESSKWVFSMDKNLAFKVCIRLVSTLNVSSAWPRYLHRKTWNFLDSPLQITWRRSTRNCLRNTLNISLQTNKKRTLRSTIG